MASTFIPDRGPDGKIIVEPTRPATLTELLPTLPDTQTVAPPTAQPTRRDLIVWGVAIGLICLVAGTLLARLGSPTPSTAVQSPTLVVVPTSAPTIAPTAAVLLDRAIVAYAAPGGDILGAVDAGRVYTAIGRYGTSWAQLDIGERAPVWVRLGDMPGLTVAGLPDLAPKPTAIPVPVVVPVVPIGVPPAACSETSATYRASQRIEKNGRLLGEVAAWSCVSQAEADQELARRAAELGR